jgi:3-(3-hydroxy-phenyl)propionate hydroxylase
MMPTSRLQAAIVQSGFRAAAFLPPVHAYFAQMKYKPKPFYGDGFIDRAEMPGLVGRMFPQPVLEMRRRTAARLDDLAGNGFALLAVGPNAQAVLNGAKHADFGFADLRRVAVLPMRINPEREGALNVTVGRDINDLLAEVLPGDRDSLVFLRPDRYVAAAGLATSDAAVAGFAARVKALVARTRAGQGGSG